MKRQLRVAASKGYTMKIKTWNERCEVHPDHQTGMITTQMIRARMQEEIDELRAALEAAPSEPVQAEPVGWQYRVPRADVTWSEWRECIDEDDANYLRKQYGYPIRPLYTAPQSPLGFIDAQRVIDAIERYKLSTTDGNIYIACNKAIDIIRAEAGKADSGQEAEKIDEDAVRTWSNADCYRQAQKAARATEDLRKFVRFAFDVRFALNIKPEPPLDSFPTSPQLSMLVEHTKFLVGLIPQLHEQIQSAY